MSTPTTRYDIITADSVTSLAMMVNEKLARGWRLQGGVSVAQSEDEFQLSFCCCQAMTLDAPPPSA